MYAFALQKWCNSFLLLLVWCFLLVAIGWPWGWEEGEAGLKQLGILPSGCIMEWLQWGIGGHHSSQKFCWEIRQISTGMLEVMRKQPTFAERDMNVGHGSRSLKVKINIWGIVTENLVLCHIGFDSTVHCYVNKKQPFLWIWDFFCATGAYLGSDGHSWSVTKCETCKFLGSCKMATALLLGVVLFRSYHHLFHMFTYFICS